MDGKQYGEKRQAGHDEDDGSHLFNMAPEAVCQHGLRYNPMWSGSSVSLILKMG